MSLILLTLFGMHNSFSSSSAEEKAANFIANKGYIVNNSTKTEQYRLEENISRKEFMKVVMKISGVDITDTCVGTFVDVSSDWGCKYIEGGLNKGYVVKNQSFRPNDKISKLEAIKLIFKSRGLNKKYPQLSWEDDYIKTAFTLGLIESTSFDYNIAASRGWIFELAAKSFSDYTKISTNIRSSVSQNTGKNKTTDTKKVFIDGKLEGEYIEYFQNGEVKLFSQYQGGKIYGEVKGFYSDGSSNYIAHYKNGKLEGEFIKYYKDGNISQKESYVKGLLSGISSFYNKEGELIKTREYIGGFLLKEVIK